MLTLDYTLSYLREHHLEDLRVVGPGEVEFLLDGGTYGTTEGAAYIDTWESLNRITIAITLLQFSYAFMMAALPAIRAVYQSWRNPPAIPPLEARASIDEIRAHVIKHLAEKHGISVPPDHPLVSDEAIMRALAEPSSDEKH